MRSSKAWFFRLFANGKTFAPSASEVKAHDLRGLNYYPPIKVLRAGFPEATFMSFGGSRDAFSKANFLSL